MKVAHGLRFLILRKLQRPIVEYRGGKKRKERKIFYPIAKYLDWHFVLKQVVGLTLKSMQWDVSHWHHPKTRLGLDIQLTPLKCVTCKCIKV